MTDSTPAGSPVAVGNDAPAKVSRVVLAYAVFAGLWIVLSDEAKSRFLANMSHEIRTPMNAIIGLTHILRHGEATPQQTAHLDKIDGASRHLLDIINDVLDLSKIDAGRMQLESMDFSLSAMLDSVASIIGEAARDKGLRIEVENDKAPPWLCGDPTRLRQALAMAGATAYDLILMDLQMPGMDGLEATRAIRATGRGGGPAATADGFHRAGYGARAGRAARQRGGLPWLVATVRRRSPRRRAVPAGRAGGGPP